MNKSHLVHTVIAVVMQVIVALVTGNWFYGVFLAGGLFWGREHAQKQDNIADAKGKTVKDLDWHEGADMTEWSSDSVLDFASPTVVTAVIALVMTFFVFV